MMETCKKKVRYSARDDLFEVCMFMCFCASVCVPNGCLCTCVSPNRVFEVIDLPDAAMKTKLPRFVLNRKHTQ